MYSLLQDHMGRGRLWHLRGLRRLSNLVLEEHFYQEMKGAERTPQAEETV